MSIAVDAVAVRAEQRRVWDDVSVGWQRWQPTFERAARIVTARLVELAEIGPADVVLDVGSGIGEPALTAARTVGSKGRVAGVDLSPRMVAAASRAAAALDNVEFHVGAVEHVRLPAGSFDAALSRWALPFAADRIELLRTVSGLLRPGGILAAAVWSVPEDVPVISLAFRALSGYLELPPPPPGPGPFTMSDPDALRGELVEAGFEGVEIETLVVPFRFDSTHDFASFSRDVLPPGMKQLLRERCGSVDAAGAWEAFARAVGPYRTAGGAVSVPSVTLCVRAVAGGEG